MYHLISHSVYNDMTPFGGNPWSTMTDIGCDGIEMLTSFDSPPESHMPYTQSVHLPYATDWLAAWEERPYEMDDVRARYYMFGRTPEDVVCNITTAMDHAAAFSPAYGVMHLGNVDLHELRCRRYSLDDAKVVRIFCEIMNRVVADMPGGEPPFKVMFENLWWPGLRLVDESDFRILDRHIEFENWGICMDTGHLTVCLPRIYTQQDAIEALLDTCCGYSRDLIDRIGTVHFHYSASAAYRESFEDTPMGDMDMTDYIVSAYPHISGMDQHLPFTDAACAEILDVLRPTYVTHEMMGDDFIEKFMLQRSLLS